MVAFAYKIQTYIFYKKRPFFFNHQHGRTISSSFIKKILDNFFKYFLNNEELYTINELHQSVLTYSELFIHCSVSHISQALRLTI